MILLQTIRDGGAFYAETNVNNLLVEPWNAISSLAFLLPVFYWLYRLRGQYATYWEITWSLPFLFLGGLGSTLYHAFRASVWLILMDALPVFLLTVALSIYFWRRVLGTWLYTLILFVGFILLQYFLFRFLGRGGINLQYFGRGVLLFLPMVIELRRINFKNADLLFIAIGFFILALIFRTLDKEAVYIMAMGSHWLWHLSTVAGVFYLSEFMYQYIHLTRLEKEFKMASHNRSTIKQEFIS